MNKQTITDANGTVESREWNYAQVCWSSTYQPPHRYMGVRVGERVDLLKKYEIYSVTSPRKTRSPFWPFLQETQMKDEEKCCRDCSPQYTGESEIKQGNLAVCPDPVVYQPPLFVSLEEAAKATGIPKVTLANLSEYWRIPSISTGDDTMFNLEQLRRELLKIAMSNNIH